MSIAADSVKWCLIFIVAAVAVLVAVVVGDGGVV